MGLFRSEGSRDEPIAAIALLLPIWISYGRKYELHHDAMATGWWKHLIRIDFSRYLAGWGIAVRFGRVAIKVRREWGQYA